MEGGWSPTPTTRIYIIAAFGPDKVMKLHVLFFNTTSGHDWARENGSTDLKYLILISFPVDQNIILWVGHTVSSIKELWRWQKWWDPGGAQDVVVGLRGTELKLIW